LEIALRGACYHDSAPQAREAYVMKDTPHPVASGLGLTALDPVFREDPSSVLDALRSSEPVHRDRTFDRIFLTRAKDITAVFNDRTLSSDPRKSPPGSFARVQLGVDENFKPTMLHLDDPEHKRLRGLVAKAFTPQSIEAMRPRIREIADKLLDAVAGQDSFDLVAAYSNPLPTIVISAMLGVNESDQEDFKRWSDARVQIFNPKRTPEQRAGMDQALQAFTNYLLIVIQERRIHRGADLISNLIGVEEGGEQLSVPDIIGIVHLLIIAGNLTTTDLLSNGALTLLRHPAELAKLRAHPERINAVVEEVLRYDSPVLQLDRVCPYAKTIDGVAVNEGQTITSSLHGANHDPAVYEDPHIFKPERADKHHYSFGGGAHYCIGAPLARAEAQIGLLALLNRFPRIRLSETRPPIRKSIPAFNGLESLYVDVD
jgi:cytochrome P450